MASSHVDEAKDDTGFIRFEAVVSEINDKKIVYSPVIEVCELEWYLWLRKRDNASHLEAFLSHQNDSVSGLWRIVVSANFTLVNFKKNGMGITKEFNATVFLREYQNKGFPDFVQWDLIDEEKGFMKDGKITVDVRFTLDRIEGYTKLLSFDFTNKDDSRLDILKIGGKNIYVSKEVLASHSNYFKAMFYQDDKEKMKKKDVELNGVNHKEFIEMLNMIYPTCKEITDANAVYLLKLGSDFMIPKLVNEVEKFLIKSEKLTLIEKFCLSDKYRSARLQDHCLDQFKSVEEIHSFLTYLLIEHGSDYFRVNKYPQGPGTVERDWLDSVVPSEVQTWMREWNGQFPPLLMTFRAGKECLSLCILAALGQRPSGPVPTPAPSAPLMAPTPPPPPPVPRGAPEAQLSVKDVLELMAARQGYTYVPQQGRMKDGKQVYWFGSQSIFLDRGLVFVMDITATPVEWRPISIHELIDIA